MIDEKEADRLEAAMRETLGITGDDAVVAHALVTEMQRLRTHNPRLFQTAMLLLMSTLISAGDKLAPISGVELAAKLDRMVGLQTELGRMLEQAKAAQKAELDQMLNMLALDRDEDDAVIPPSKLN